MSDKIVNTIYETMEYDKFKLLEHNRLIENRRLVDALKESFTKFGYDTGLPVVVTKDWYIKDGQHRFQACKELGLPIVYTFTSNADVFDSLIAINNISCKWKMKDFLHQHIELNNPNYLAIQDLAEELNLNDKYNKNDVLMMALAYMHGDRISDPRDLQVLKEGNYTFNEELADVARAAAKEIEQISDALATIPESKKLFNRKQCIFGYLQLRSYPNFKFSRMLTRMKESGGRNIRTRGDDRDMLINLADIYNKHLSTGKIEV